jgi:hypothetical protein
MIVLSDSSSFVTNEVLGILSSLRRHAVLILEKSVKYRILIAKMPQRWFIHYFENGQYHFTPTSGDRIAHEARSLVDTQGLPLFQHVITYHKKDLGDEFNRSHEAHFQYTRGAGYYVWKSRVVQLTLEKMSDGDELLYLDSSIEISNPLASAFKLLDEQDIIPFYQPYTEKPWTKADVIAKLKSPPEHLETIQPMAGVLLMRKTPAVIALVNEWVELSSDLHLIDDSPSIIPNHPEFIEHRHDQSIWSLLLKRECYKIYPRVVGISHSRNFG